jgi:hypothetical protein
MSLWLVHNEKGSAMDPLGRHPAGKATAFYQRAMHGLAYP